MGDPAVTRPTIRHGIIEKIAKHLLSFVAIVLFLLIGTASAGAVELIDDVVEVLPVEEATDSLPVDEVVEVLPLPAPEPEPARSTPAATEPDAEPAPATSPPAAPRPDAPAEAPDAPAATTEPSPVGSDAPVAVVDDAVSGLEPVVAELPGPVTDPVSQPPPAVIEPSPSPSPDLDAPPILGSVRSVVDSLVADETAGPLHLTPTIDDVRSGLDSLQETPVLEDFPHLPVVVADADRLVVNTARDLVASVGSLIAPSLLVLDNVLEPVSDLVEDTVSGLEGTVDSLVPILPVSGSSPPVVIPGVVIPGHQDPVAAPDPGDGRRTGSAIPPPTPVGRIGPVVTTEPVGPETDSERAGMISRPAPHGLVDVALTADILPPGIADQAPTTRSQHDPAGDGNWAWNSGPTPSILPSSNSNQVFSFVGVLALLGLVAPRLSRWLRSQPVLWRPYALALAIERPG